MISRRCGFTLIELIITIAIVAILMAVATPSLRDVGRNARMTSLVNDLMTDLSVARAEAVKRGVRASVCTSTSGTGCTATAWRDGWIIFSESHTGGTPGVVDANDVILKVIPRISGADETLITITNNPTAAGASYIEFRPSGVTSPGGAGAARIDIYICDARRTGTEAFEKGRHIILAGTGRAHSTRCTCVSAGTSCTP